jgi:hypothetical protein
VAVLGITAAKVLAVMAAEELVDHLTLITPQLEGLQIQAVAVAD